MNSQNHDLVLFDSEIGPLSSATTPGQSGPGSDDNEGVLHIPQSSSITGTSPSVCFVLYPGHSLRGGSYPLQRSSWCILQPQPTGAKISQAVKTHKTSVEWRKEYELVLKYKKALCLTTRTKRKPQGDIKPIIYQLKMTNNKINR